MLKLVFFVPESHKEKVKKALFEIGAGSMNKYEQCSFEVEGVGQFCPQNGANPFLGQNEMLEKVREFRVEMILKNELATTAKKILLQAHPYEVPAFEFFEILDI